MVVLDIKVIFRVQVPLFVVDRAHKSVNVRIKNAPERGKANKELVKVLAQALRIPQTSIRLISGMTTRYKKVALNIPLTLEQVFDTLASVSGSMAK
jgi:uncharacterized protein